MTKTSAYAIPGINKEEIPGPVKRLTLAIAEAWGIPEDKVLGSTNIIPKKHPSPSSNIGERIRTPGERRRQFADARKFYFYVMYEIKRYPYRDLWLITGRRIAYINYMCKEAKEHMSREKDYKEKADSILALIEQNKIDFPTRTVIIEANATIINR
jgi:hypothetical protein